MGCGSTIGTKTAANTADSLALKAGNAALRSSQSSTAAVIASVDSCSKCAHAKGTASNLTTRETRQIGRKANGFDDDQVTIIFIMRTSMAIIYLTY